MYDKKYLLQLINELRSLPCESEWVEFKHNSADPQEIGEYISALANSAALALRKSGYLIWGIDAATHDIAGTIRVSVDVVPKALPGSKLHKK
jgi:ATP-dependent DNA helicase RecG